MQHATGYNHAWANTPHDHVVCFCFSTCVGLKCPHHMAWLDPWAVSGEGPCNSLFDAKYVPTPREMMIETNCALKEELLKRSEENNALALHLEVIKKEMASVVKALKEELAKKDEELLALRTATPRSTPRALCTKQAKDAQPSPNPIQLQSTAAAVRRILQGPLQYTGPLPDTVEEMLQLVASRSAEATDKLKLLTDFARSVRHTVWYSRAAASAGASGSNTSSSLLAEELKNIETNLHEVLEPRKQDCPPPPALHTSPAEGTGGVWKRDRVRSDTSGEGGRSRPSRPPPPASRPLKSLPTKRAKEEPDNAISSESSDSAVTSTQPITWIYRRNKPSSGCPSPDPGSLHPKSRQPPAKGPARDATLPGRRRSTSKDRGSSKSLNDPSPPPARRRSTSTGRGRALSASTPRTVRIEEVPRPLPSRTVKSARGFRV